MSFRFVGVILGRRPYEVRTLALSGRLPRLCLAGRWYVSAPVVARLRAEVGR